MGKKRSRDADGQEDVDMADSAVTKRDDDDSSDDEVRRNSHKSLLFRLTPSAAL
jgi:protein BCP1